MSVPTNAAATSTSSSSLYVGDLHWSITDGVLFEHFSEFKSLTSVRVCRDASSGRSLCYGYVNFLSQADASRAIETKNNTILHGKTIRVTWSCRDPDARRSGKGNIFVKNLGDSVDNLGLQDIFKQFGNIISCKVVMSEDGKSKCYGFVQFDTDESANAAIEKLNGSVSGDKQLHVAKFVNRSDRILSRLEAKYTNLYVKNLDPDLTEELLREKFSEFGNITSLVISKDEAGCSRGFGFINYENPDDAKRAAETMNGYQLGSSDLYVARAQKRVERDEILRRHFEEKRKESILKYKDSNIYIKNIDDDVSDQELEQHFSQCGTITSAKIMRDDKGISKGFGFVCFSSPEEANNAVNTLHGFMFHKKPLYVAIAQKKEDRQAHLQLQYAQRMTGLAGVGGAGASSGVIPAGGFFHPYYFPAGGPTNPISQVPARPGLMYQPPPPLGLRPGWRGNNGLAPAFSPLPMSRFPQDMRHNRVRMNGPMIPHGAAPGAAYIPYFHQTPQWVGHGRYVPNGRVRADKGTGVLMSSSASAATATATAASLQGTEMLSSRLLSAASPDRQKQILGERLYPLVQNLKPEQGSKITGMLLEMDNSELLLLLESPDSLASKVEEAVEVLKVSKSKASNQGALQSNFLSAEVAVN